MCFSLMLSASLLFLLLSSWLLVVKIAWIFFFFFFFFTSLNQEVALEEMKKELQARPTEKLVDDLHKKVKILQVVRSLLCY
jgi:hypothetical protein